MRKIFGAAKRKKAHRPTGQIATCGDIARATIGVCHTLRASEYNNYHSMRTFDNNIACNCYYAAGAQIPREGGGSLLRVFRTSDSSASSRGTRISWAYFRRLRRIFASSPAVCRLTSPLAGSNRTTALLSRRGTPRLSSKSAAPTALRLTAEPARAPPE